METVIRKINGNAAPGGMELSTRHLKQLTTTIEAKAENGLLQQLADFCTMLASGKGPRSIANHITSAQITPLKKGNNDLRPIAVVGTLRKLVSTLLMQRVKIPTSEYLRPIQWGVATKYGTEVITHATRACVDKLGYDPSYGLFKADFRNAFNLISRKMILVEARKHAPEIWRWAKYFYAEKTKPIIRYRDITIQNLMGVQQGDPLGSLLYALAIQPILLKIKSIISNVTANEQLYRLVAAYLDDTIVIARHTQLREVISFLQSEQVQSYGVEVKKWKSTIWWPSPADTETKHLYAPFHISTESDTEILSNPIVGLTYMHNKMRTTLNKIEKTLETLKYLDDAHVVFALTRN